MSPVANAFLVSAVGTACLRFLGLGLGLGLVEWTLGQLTMNRIFVHSDSSKHGWWQQIQLCFWCWCFLWLGAKSRWQIKWGHGRIVPLPGLPLVIMVPYRSDSSRTLSIIVSHAGDAVIAVD